MTVAFFSSSSSADECEETSCAGVLLDFYFFDLGVLAGELACDISFLGDASVTVFGEAIFSSTLTDKE